MGMFIQFQAGDMAAKFEANNRPCTVPVRKELLITELRIVQTYIFVQKKNYRRIDASLTHRKKWSENRFHGMTIGLFKWLIQINTKNQKNKISSCNNA